MPKNIKTIMNEREERLKDYLKNHSSKPQTKSFMKAQKAADRRFAKLEKLFYTDQQKFIVEYNKLADKQNNSGKFKNEYSKIDEKGIRMFGTDLLKSAKSLSLSTNALEQLKTQQLKHNLATGLTETLDRGLEGYLIETGGTENDYHYYLKVMNRFMSASADTVKKVFEENPDIDIFTVMYQPDTWSKAEYLGKIEAIGNSLNVR